MLRSMRMWLPLGFAVLLPMMTGAPPYNGPGGRRGGVVPTPHQGKPISFDLDCARPEVVCPSEAWPATVTAEQRNTQFEHRMIVTLPTQSCSVPLTAPAPGR